MISSSALRNPAPRTYRRYPSAKNGYPLPHIPADGVWGLGNFTGISHPGLIPVLNLRKYDIHREYSNMSDAALDQIVREYRLHRPDSGIRYVHGHVRDKGHLVQRERVKNSLKRLNAVGVQIRRRNAIVRKVYESLGPNLVWHMDGHHKLILWGIVIHGMIDGYCRTVRKGLASEYWLILGGVDRWSRGQLLKSKLTSAESVSQSYRDIRKASTCERR